MKRSYISLALVAMMATVIFGSAGIAEAQQHNTRESEIKDDVRSLSSKIEDLDYNLADQLRSDSTGRDDVTRITDAVRDLKSSVANLQSNVDKNRDNAQDINGVVNTARVIEAFFKTNPPDPQITDKWNAVRSQIDRLAADYGVTPSWNGETSQPAVADDQGPVQGTARPVQTGTINVGLSGTYQLDLAKSETLDDALGDVTLTGDQRTDLKDKLEAPGQIAIDISGNRVTLATSAASPVSFMADGSEKVEQAADGTTVHLRARIDGSVLTVSSIGGDTDYTITFTSDDNGGVLKVSRRITTGYLTQTVFAESVYNKSDSVAGLGINVNGNGNPPSGTTNSQGGYSDNDQTTPIQNGGQQGSQNNSSPPPYNPPTNPPSGQSSGQNGTAPSVAPARVGQYTVPNGTIITAVLDTEISTRMSQNNDRFKMTVTSPSEYKGAVIEGYVSGVGRAGKITGRSTVTFNFDRITLADGTAYDFAGFLQAVRDQNGKNLKVDAEGTAKSGDQTNQAITRGGIGAGLGALIGVIAGGARGAVLGAVIGGGGGAGSVAIQGHNDVQLRQGSTITVESSSPIRQNQPTDK